MLTDAEGCPAQSGCGTFTTGTTSRRLIFSRFGGRLRLDDQPRGRRAASSGSSSSITDRARSCARRASDDTRKDNYSPLPWKWLSESASGGSPAPTCRLARHHRRRHLGAAAREQPSASASSDGSAGGRALASRQPRRGAEQLRGTWARVAGDPPAAGDLAHGHTDRAGWDRQESSRAPSGSSAGEALSQRRVVGGALRGGHAPSGGPGDRPGAGRCRAARRRHRRRAGGVPP